MTSTIIFTTANNTTFDFYIKPRISCDAAHRVQLIDPWRFTPAPSIVGDDCTVIINRYLSFNSVRWIRKHANRIDRLVWVVDDDFRAMLTDRSIPLTNRYRPLVTLLLTPVIQKQVRLLVCSSEALAHQFPHLQSIICPPIADLTELGDKPFDANQLFYFAKMHEAEHRFLFPIISTILERNPDASFTVIADGKLAQMWSDLDNVQVLPEMRYPDYCEMVERLPKGGLFLAPLLPSPLNSSRSMAKLIEVARSYSCPIVSDHPEFRKGLGQNWPDLLPNDKQAWIDAIQFALNHPQRSVSLAQKLKIRLQTMYDERETLVN